ncbi:MAG: thiol-disulfide oxidoreductase DCC family protein [Alphaproteobacteria bacterium]
MNKTMDHNSKGFKQTVYYDGACPLCSREIAFYRQRDGAESMEWIDASACDADALGPDLDRKAALGVMHVRGSDGELWRGAESFLAIWRELPGFRWLTWLLDNPIGRPLMDWGYKGFLRIRPFLVQRAADNRRS